MTWRLKSSVDVQIHPFRLLTPWPKKINWRNRQQSLKIFSNASLWWTARNAWLSRTSWNTLFLNNTKTNLRIILSFTRNWRTMESIKKIKSLERSTAWIARWSQKMNQERIFWRRKWLVPSPNICNVSLKKFSSKSARHNTWRSVPLNFSITMLHIWPMPNVLLPSFTFLRPISSILILFFMTFLRTKRQILYKKFQLMVKDGSNAPKPHNTRNFWASCKKKIWRPISCLRILTARSM